jgi:membrane protease YdiL (CAAX protease family)
LQPAVPPLPLRHVAALTAALILVYQAGAWLFLSLLAKPRTGLLVTGPFLVLLPLIGALRAARLPVRDSLRVRPVRMRAALLAALGVVAAAPPVLAFAATFVRTPERVEEFFTTLLRASSGVDLVVVLAAAALVPAVTEEILFRGFLQGALERSAGRWAGILLTAALFGLIHGFSRAPAAAALGALLGWTVARTGSIVPAVAGHAAVNALAVTLVNSPGFGTGAGWPETLPLPALLVWTAISIAALSAFAHVTRTERAPASP